MQVSWNPSKPVRITRRITSSLDRLARGFQKRTGRWPQTGVIFLDEKLKRVERIEFEPESLRGQ